MKLSFGLWVGMAAAVPMVGAAPLVLDNGIVRLNVDPEQGGAITHIVYEKAVTFPLIAERGAGVAGSGRLFAPAVVVKDLNAGALALDVLRQTRTDMLLSGALPEVARGLVWQRRIALIPGASRFEIEDELRNDSDREVVAKVGADSWQQGETWRLTDRSWIGNPHASRLLATSDRKDVAPSARLSGGRVFWRQIEQYGTGFTYRVSALPAAGEITADEAKGVGHAVEVVWRSGAVAIPAHGKVALRSEVLVDEGGGAPDQENAFAPVLARADFAHAGRLGQLLLGSATVVSPRAERVTVVVTSDHELVRQEMELRPGKVARLPVRIMPASKGEMSIRVDVLAGGKSIATAATSALIDGDAANPVWQRFASRMPEEYYHGSWTEIGEQLVRGGQPIGGPTALPISLSLEAVPNNSLAYYERRFPYGAELMQGIAKASKVAAARVLIRFDGEDPRGACMDAVYYGPDGPINAFSKERYNNDPKGDGYVKVWPSQGYPFHYFESYGVNSEGLSISGAAGCENAESDVIADRKLAAWNRAGKPTLPSKLGLWLIFATCKNVEEALAVIHNPEAPFLFTGNMFLVDRAGNAARVESVVMERQVFRHRPSDRGLFIAGNFQHERPDGVFKTGHQWGWSANSMVRERFLNQFVGARQGHVSLEDVFEIMQTHEAGGMCQHHYDDAGQLYTDCSFIAVPRTNELWLAEGPPCEVGYVRYALTK